MQGMLLGLGDIIGSAFSAALGGIFEIILTPLMNLVVVPVINMVINLFMQIFGYFFYLLGVFILALIDFTEMLFRALAGLEAVDASRPYAELSLDGKSGDILIQLIRNPAIQEAFLAMCIVGLFLLVITTVFQIIKVEYTTEGAKNAKGPIFQKAFKALANLMLLPLLVVFGVYLANQVLGLLDTATRGEGKNPTISGQIFATAASEAFYRENDVLIVFTNNETSTAIKVILKNLDDILFDAIGDAWTPDSEEAGYLNDEDERETILENVVQQAEGYKYYRAYDMSYYFALSKINYILLIFGGFTVLKCLFFSCFGMIIRLYKCAILFIMAPVVIGMTPINEGGLGKWRTSFMGQVLSAYGTILAINLFFVIVRVLLNINIKFVNMDGWALTADFLTQILKSIIVIAGCLLIEKFAKEIGGYFGAEDAMGAGKDMAKQVGDTAMKGVKLAAGVATGGAGLALSVGRGAMALGQRTAGGLQGRMANHLSKSNVAEDRVKADNLMLKSEKNKASAKKNFDKTFVGQGVNKAKGAVGFVKDGMSAKKASKTIKANNITSKHNEMMIDYNNQQIADIDEKLKDKNLSDADRTAYTNQKNEFIKDNISRQSTIEAISDNNAKLAKDVKPWQDRKDKASEGFNVAKLRAKSLVTGLADQGTAILPGAKLFGDLSKAEDAGAKKLGPEFESAVQRHKDDKEKERQDAAYNDNKDVIQKANKGGYDKAADKFTETLSSEEDKTRRELEKLGNRLVQSWNGLDDTQKKSYAWEMEEKAGALGSKMSQAEIYEMLGDKAVSGEKVELGDFKVELQADKISAKVKDIMSSNKTLEQKMEDLKALMSDIGKNDNKTLLKNMEKALEELKNQLSGK